MDYHMNGMNMLMYESKMHQVQLFNIKPTHVSASTGHDQMAKPTLQRKLFVCMENTGCHKGISCSLNREYITINIINPFMIIYFHHT
jgi:hypothetical protein